MEIGVIGLGKLGLPLAGVLAQHFDVIGVDLTETKVEDNEDKELQDMDLSRLTTTTDFSKLSTCDVIFNIVPTPSMEDGKFTDKYVRSSIQMAKPYLNCKVFVITSTVMPGTCEDLKKDLPCKLCYNPEFIRLGHVAKDMINPDFVLIGEEDKEAGDILESIYKKIVKSPIKRMDLTSAELAKITLNSFITLKITFANILGEIAESIGADPHKILDAIGEDRRINHNYFKFGGAYGGPCFPRDNRAFDVVADGIENYALFTDKLNRHIAKKFGYFSPEPRYQNIDQN